MRRVRLGLPTILGLKPRGYFIPYRYAGELPPLPATGAYPGIEALLRGREQTFEDVLAAIDHYADQLLAFEGGAPGTPRWNQDWFPRLDGAAAYALVRQRRPRQIIEVGSGHSTRILARAVLDEGVDCRITAIDPAPRAGLRALTNVTHVEAPLQSLLGSPKPPRTSGSAAGLFRELLPGDLLFIDSSHILMPGSDVDLLLNRVLPHLPAGVLVHVHDIFLPDDYPPSWRWRGYNEQLGIAPLLTMGAWEVLFASWYVSTRMADAVSRCVASKLPLQSGAFETSLWLVKG